MRISSLEREILQRRSRQIENPLYIANFPRSSIVISIFGTHYVTQEIRKTSLVPPNVKCVHPPCNPFPVSRSWIHCGRVSHAILKFGTIRVRESNLVWSEFDTGAIDLQKPSSSAIVWISGFLDQHYGISNYIKDSFLS